MLRRLYSIQIIFSRGNYCGSGDSFEDPISITGAKNAMEGLAAEKSYLQQKLDDLDENWKIGAFEVIAHRNQFIDNATVENTKSDQEVVHFLIGEEYFE